MSDDRRAPSTAEQAEPPKASEPARQPPAGNRAPPERGGDLRELPAPPLTPAHVVQLVLLVGVVVVLAVLLWQLSDVLLLAFAAVLVAIVLHTIATGMERYSPLGTRASLGVATLLVAAVLAGFFVLLGAQIRSEFTQLMETFPEALASLGDRVGIEDLNVAVAERAQDLTGRASFLSRIAGYTTGVLGALASVVLVIVAGIFLASQPERYRRGIVVLMPPRMRGEAERLLENIGHALQRWLLGQAVSMALIGVATTAGLYAIGVPSALALGFLAGVAAFVPLIGPVLSAIPAVLIAFPDGTTTVLLVIALYVVVQQIESNLIMPLVQRRAVDLPPVLTLFAVLAFGVLFGPLGLLFGTPLAVVLFVAVKQLYVRDALGEPTNIPGETTPPGAPR